MTQHKEYDADALVLALAMGQKTYAQIGAEFGLTDVYVGEISRGEKRPELQKAIQAITDGLLQEARRLGAQSARSAMARLLTLIADPQRNADGSPGESEVDPEIQRKAAVDILRHTMGDPGKTEVNVNQGGPIGIKPTDVQEFYRFLAQRDGGPPDDDGEDRA